MRAVLVCALLAGAAYGQDDPLSKGEIARVVDEYLAARAAAEADPWAALAVYGDLRLRQEESFELTGAPDRHRSRLRLRLGATWATDDALEVGARLVTGSRQDPRSPHVTLGDGFDGLELSLDRAYVTWRPMGAAAAWVTGGKFSHPMRRNPVYGELVWDADVQPEGLALGTALDDVGPLDRLELTLGQYALVEQSLAEDAWATFAQVAARERLGAGVEAGLSASYTFVGDPTPGGGGALVGDDRGNALIGGEFASDFGVLDVIGDVTLDGGARPWVLSAEWIDNLRARSAGSGWALGIAWGRAALAGDWRAYYQVQTIEQDAVFSPFTQDDFTLATGHESHVFGVNRQLSDGVGLHLWSLISAPRGADGDDEWRVRLDLNVKF